MTYIGKILVLIIMVLSLVFLSLSTVVFMTERDYKKEVDRLKETLSKTSAELNLLKTEKAELETTVEAAEKDREQALQGINNNVAQLKDEIEKRQAEITAQRTAVETAQENVRSAQAEAEAKAKETSTAREQLRAVQIEANNYKDQQLELKDMIRQLERELGLAKDNNKYLRDRMVTLQNVIRQNGLDPDPRKYEIREIPPDVDGQIVRSDAQNRRFEISIGSDDGLVVGHELVVYRLDPQPEYLGRVKVQVVDSDQAYVTVIGSTPQGKKIQEGDIVSTTIRPRG
jgi:ABC-type Na+ efflux pump permease subunit